MTLILRYWREAGLLAAGVIILLLSFMLRASNAERDQCGRENKTWASTSKTQEESIITLQDALNRKNAETDARNAALTKQLEDDAKSRAQSDLRAATTQKRLDALNRIAANGTSVCGVSDELRAALKGL